MPARRKIVIRFGMANTAINGVTRYLNPDNVRIVGNAAEATCQISVPLKDGERFVPTAICVDACTAPAGVTTATYQLRRNGANNGATVVITGAAVAGRGNPGNGLIVTAYGPADRMALNVTGSAGAAAHTSDTRVEGYVLGRGR
jgi:hypothetical protein